MYALKNSDLPVPRLVGDASSRVARTSARTLIVDDDPLIRELFSAVLLDEGYEVAAVACAGDALATLKRATFDVLLCDITMPGPSGLDLLREVHELYPDMPVIMITGHSDVELVRRALSDGASDFVTKPCSVGELPVIVERNLTRHALACRKSLVHRQQLSTSYEAVLDALLTALDTRNTETEGHSERVTAYTMLLSERMAIPGDQLYHIERGALLHDIGKIGVPDRILLKSGPLDDLEWAEMRRHSFVGYTMCSRVGFLNEAAEIVLHHHEQWGGGGYPNGLAGREIPLGARVFAVADALDAMTTDRPYRDAVAYEQARQEIASHSGDQFDPEVVEAFLAVHPDAWLNLRRELGM